MRKVILFSLVAGLLLISLAIGGCGPKPAKYALYPSVESQEKIVFLDKRLRNDLRIEDVSVDRSQTGRLSVTIKVINKRDKPIECRVKYKFTGKGGAAIDETGWMPVVFDRREVTQLEQKTLSSKAEDFTVLLRYEKKLKGFKK